jgi:hypothetical protein
LLRQKEAELKDLKNSHSILIEKMGKPKGTEKQED